MWVRLELGCRVFSGSLWVLLSRSILDALVLPVGWKRGGSRVSGIVGGTSGIAWGVAKWVWSISIQRLRIWSSPTKILVGSTALHGSTAFESAWPSEGCHPVLPAFPSFKLLFYADRCRLQVR